MTDQKFPWEEIGDDSPPPDSPTALPRESSGKSAPMPLHPRSTKTPRKYPNPLKFEVTVAALRGDTTQQELSDQYGVPQPLISLWKAAGITAIRESIENRPGKGGMKPLQGDPVESILSKAEQEGIVKLCDMLRKTASLLEDVPRAAKSRTKQSRHS